MAISLAARDSCATDLLIVLISENAMTKVIKTETIIIPKLTILDIFAVLSISALSSTMDAWRVSVTIFAFASSAPISSIVLVIVVNWPVCISPIVFSILFTDVIPNITLIIVSIIGIAKPIIILVFIFIFFITSYLSLFRF